MTSGPLAPPVRFSDLDQVLGALDAIEGAGAPRLGAGAGHGLLHCAPGTTN